MKTSNLQWVIFFTVFSAALNAHRHPEVLTTIQFNENTQKTEIVHCLHAHDVAIVLKGIHGTPPLSLDSIEGRARIALYVEDKFSVINPQSGTPLELDLIGAETEGGNLYVYQEYHSNLVLPIAISNRILCEFYSNQKNFVNIKSEGKVSTMLFIGDKYYEIFDIDD